MIDVNKDASIRISTTLSLLLHLQRQLSGPETVALIKYLRRTLPVTTLEVREDQFVQASWVRK